MEPYVVPDELIKPPPRGHLERALYLKHVDISGRLVKPPMRYDKVEGGNLILEYLISAHGPQVGLYIWAYQPISVYSRSQSLRSVRSAVGYTRRNLIKAA